MARQKEKRRVAKESLALAVRKHFNSAAVNEIDVVVEVIYRVKNQGMAFTWTGFRGTERLITSTDRAFRMRSAPTGVKKS